MRKLDPVTSRSATLDEKENIVVKESLYSNSIVLFGVKKIKKYLDTVLYTD